MRRHFFSIFVLAMVLGLTGCGENSDSRYGDIGGGSGPIDDGTGGGSGADEIGIDRLFHCEPTNGSPNSFDLNLSSDGNRATVIMDNSSTLFTRSDEADDSDGETGTFVEYQSANAAMAELRLEGSLVIMGAVQGRAEVGNSFFNCNRM